MGYQDLRLGFAEEKISCLRREPNSDLLSVQPVA